MSNHRLNSLLGYFSPFVLIGAVVFGFLLFGALLLAMQLLRPQAQPPSVGTAMLFVIEASTSTPVVTPEAPTPTPAPNPQADVSGLPVAVGSYVQVSGTGIDGLRMRVAPGLASQVRFVAIEAEVFQVIDGPQDIDGYVWWHLQAPYDENVNGWAVAQYLGVIQRDP